MPSEPKLVYLQAGPLNGRYCLVTGDMWIHPPLGRYHKQLERPCYIKSTMIHRVGSSDLPVFVYERDIFFRGTGFRMPLPALTDIAAAIEDRNKPLPDKDSQTYEIEMTIDTF